MEAPEAEAIAADLVRALRGRRSQSEFSRRLGYRSNIVRRWEASECVPTAATFLEAYSRLQPDTMRLYEKFFQRTPEWLDPKRPFDPAAIAASVKSGCA